MCGRALTHADGPGESRKIFTHGSFQGRSVDTSLCGRPPLDPLYFPPRPRPLLLQKQQRKFLQRLAGIRSLRRDRRQAQIRGKFVSTGKTRRILFCLVAQLETDLYVRILFVLVELSIRCVARTTVRESAEITSAKTGILAVGDEIEAFEEREVPIEPAGTATGSAPMTTVRVRCHLGWVSKIGGVGSRKATQDRQLASSVIRQQGTPILEEIHANPIPEEKRMDEGEVDADSAMVPAHAGLVLGGPYTTDPQVVFCPAIRWQQDQEGRDRRDVKVRWLRRHRPEVEGQASAGDAGSGDWIPIAGANGWSYTPCVTDVDCELQAVVRSGGSSARETRVRPVSDDASLDLVQNAQQVRLNRLTSGRAVQGSFECTGDGASGRL